MGRICDIDGYFFYMLIIVCRTIVATSYALCVATAKAKSPILLKFGKRIHDERARRGISQERLGELAKVHRTYIGMIERGEKNITLTNIEKLSKALGVRISDLFL
jgi:ribosome-binding protein aMBF1 (putative translation factor)